MKHFSIFLTAALVSMSFIINCLAQSPDTQSNHSTEESVNITLTIGKKIIPAILYNTSPAKDLIKRLPVTVSLNRGPVDYCGGIAPIAYSEDDAQTGYRAGDLAYWIPGKDFVIFIENKAEEGGTPDLVIIGQLRSDINEIRAQGSSINVTIALAGQNG